MHAIFQLFEKITYVTLTYNTALLPSLLTIFAGVRKEQYHRLFSCYTTAYSRAPVFQQWRLNSWTLDFLTHWWARLPSAFLLLYHSYFPCTCLPAVALKFVDPRLLNPLLDALPPLLGATTTGGLYATRRKSHQLPWSAQAQPAGKLSNQYAENREI